MPLRKPYAQLNFETASELTGLRLSGACLKNAEIFFVIEDQKRGYDQLTQRRLGERKGRYLTFDVPQELRSEKISSILIAAKIEGADDRVLLELNPAQKAAQ